MLPLSCLTVGILLIGWCAVLFLCQIYLLELCPKCSILVLSDRTTFPTYFWDISDVFLQNDTELGSFSLWDKVSVFSTLPIIHRWRRREIVVTCTTQLVLARNCCSIFSHFEDGGLHCFQWYIQSFCSLLMSDIFAEVPLMLWKLCVDRQLEDVASRMSGKHSRATEIYQGMIKLI